MGRLLYRTLPAAAAALLAPRAGAAPPGLDAGSGLSMQMAPALAALAAGSEPVPEPPPPPKPFGEQDSWRWYIQGGAGLDVTDAGNQLYLLGGGVSYFVVNDLSINFELNGLGVLQAGDDAAGVNLGFLVRFHFVNRRTWSLYGELGAGILGTTADVPGPSAAEPRGGTQFSFTPQIGGGVTVQVRPDVHLMAGARWFHISNANTWADNPGRDSILFYAGVTVPF